MKINARFIFLKRIVLVSMQSFYHINAAFLFFLNKNRQMYCYVKKKMYLCTVFCGVS